MSQLAELLAVFPEPETPITLDDLLKLIDVDFIDASSVEPLVYDYELDSERVAFLRLLTAQKEHVAKSEYELNSERANFLRLLSERIKATQPITRTKQQPRVEGRGKLPTNHGWNLSQMIDVYRPKRQANEPRIRVVERERPEIRENTPEELANFTPYEVLQSEVAFNLGCSASKVRFFADKKGLLYRWPGVGPERVYLVRNRDEEASLQIKHRSMVCGGKFEGYVPHGLSDKKSILFAKRRYPYSFNAKDVLSLERRLGVSRIEIARRAVEAEFSERGIEILSREDEIRFLYAKSKVPDSTRKNKENIATNKKGKNPTYKVKFYFPTHASLPKDRIKSQRKVDKQVDQAFKRLKKLETFACLKDVQITEEDLDYLEKARPVTREDCAYIPRPCPFLICPYNMVLDLDVGYIHNIQGRLDASGNVLVYNPDKSFLEQTHSCTLDVAEAGPLTLEEVGEIFGITRERIRQLLERELKNLKPKFSIMFGEKSENVLAELFRENQKHYS